MPACARTRLALISHHVRRVGAVVRDIRTALDYRMFMAVGHIYLAAGSFIGFESLALILGYATIWPIAIPVIIAVIAAVAVVVRWLRARRHRIRGVASAVTATPAVEPATPVSSNGTNGCR